MDKAMNFKFCTHIHRIDRNKSPLKISAKVAVGVLKDSRKFSGHPYIGRITRSSLRQLSFLFRHSVDASNIARRPLAIGPVSIDDAQRMHGSGKGQWRRQDLVRGGA